MTRLTESSELAGRMRAHARTARAPVVHILAEGNAREINTVRWFTRQMRQPAIRMFALAANRLANGSLYLIIGAAFWLWYGMPGAVAGAAVAMAFGHLIYPLIKRRYCRRRPFRYDPSIPSLLPPLDDFSFPSGHMMSCVAVLTPLCVAVPTLLPAMAALLLMVGWARLAAGHHYPTDLIAGSLLGLMVALPSAALQVTYG
ncbi:phosphatase PAP2 family protein [Pacificimonas sp. WHA3]|uniref:Phosphatase PAP2 family protein n=1 Tax=Pacificimonas pallii TaxID=2827236 RepID=A0ABS6SHA6_9SPHN|nr:phosphatase PAP2 family protein [Pacificimonas pallii]MBV7257797.1 phosphatase PAP2 family protein [Pacificimonas pallii]